MKIVDSRAIFSTRELNQLFNTKIQIKAHLSISTDSRKIRAEEIFMPIKGENFDGHDYINNIFEKFKFKDSANINIFSFCEKRKLKKVKKQFRKNLILVKDTLEAYHRLANYHRKKVNPKVIAVTGSSGKTTTKDLLTSVLSSVFKVHKTEANFNNEIGLPKTILDMPRDTEVLVLELAMRGRGEIEFLSKTAEPDIAVITNIGAAHIGRLGSLEAIAKAKSEILKHLKKGGLAVLHNDKKLLKTAEKIWKGKTASFDLSNASEISFEAGKTSFTIDIKGLLQEKYYIPAMGTIHVLNSLIAILTAKYLGLSKFEIQRGLSGFRIPAGRGEIIRMSNNRYFIDETYNANPDSVKAAVSNLIQCWRNGYKRILVLGELAELGKHEKKLLRELSNWLNAQELSQIITVGKRLKSVFKNPNVKNTDNIDDCRAILKKLQTPHSVTLIKGSRVAGLEKLITGENLVKNKN